MKRKKLGVWNRLAIVFTVLITLGVSAYFGIRDDQRIGKMGGDGWNSCRTASIQRGHNYGSFWNDPDFKKCVAENEEFVESQELIILTKYTPNRMLATLAVCGLVYLLIWLSVSVIKWVLRGRQPEAT
ncbi:hypothetical protein AB4Y32_03385 [Paraburkholderia phymatum]|uniref:Uncharacterized protein n=1 Tax=Paraburkholderia phymatum TaxID=148447 RepID=A0ACC6TTV5_9BURK